MRTYLNGFIFAITLCSIALNIAQYNGVLNSPMLAKIQPTEQQETASAFGGN